MSFADENGDFGLVYGSDCSLVLITFFQTLFEYKGVLIGDGANSSILISEDVDHKVFGN